MTTSIKSFVHLNVHSEFSLKDGMAKVKTLVAAAKAQAMPAIGLTDHMNLFGLVKFYRSAIAAGIKPIVGSDVYLYDETNDAYYGLTLIAKNNQGYLAIKKLLSLGYQQGQKNKKIPHITWQWLQDYYQGLIVLSGALKGDVGAALIKGDKDSAKALLLKWRDLFANDYYIELQRLGFPNEEQYIQDVVALAKEMSMPVVATNAVRFIKEGDYTAHEARVCIATGYVLEDHRRQIEYKSTQYLQTTKQMQELFKDIPSALENAYNIARRATVTLELGKVYLPDFPTPQGVGVDDYLRQVSLEGLQKLFPDGVKQEYINRLNIECDVIIKMGFPGYFLIVADFIEWAKNQNIPVGPGRGSGAGSLVAYVLGITALDPIKLELLFERFLNPERVSMPDFDIDFCMLRRDEVIGYVAQKYGQDCVSQIITFGTMAAKAVVRDVGRVLSYPYGFVDKIAKMIPFELGITLDKALETEEELQKRYQQENEVRHLIDLAKQLEGVTRHAGKHAGGVVIAPTALSDFAPLYCEADQAAIVTQYDKDDIESVGLVKFDFLGLRTLTIIAWAVDSINQLGLHGEQGLDINQIPWDDKKTFKLLKSNETSAVFQLESRGMKDLIRRLQPDSFEEITALVALFRPGPLQSGMVDDFIDCKHKRKAVKYLHPMIENVLEPTYGVILYQEQVMKIAQILANYSLGSADILRRAMGKKKPEEMEKQRSIFVEGCSKNDISAKKSNDIFNLIEKFAGYGFNKSHSAAYALIAYQTAWLKAQYPACFMAAALSSDMDNTDKVELLYLETVRLGISVIKPNVNHCSYMFEPNKQGEIYYGLGAIKGLGEVLIKAMVSERIKNGSYENLFDLVSRNLKHKINRRALDALIHSGACDVFGKDRSVLFASVDRALKLAQQQMLAQQDGQTDLFASLERTQETPLAYASVPPYSTLQRLDGEKTSLGLYMSGHPMDRWAKELYAITSKTLASVKVVSDKSVLIAGQIASVRKIMTKKHRLMAVVQLQDASACLDVTVFPKLYESHYELLSKDALVICKGVISEDDFSGQPKMIADEMMPIEAWRLKAAKRICFDLEAGKVDDILLQSLQNILKKSQGGQCAIKFDYTSDSGQCTISSDEQWRIHPTNVVLHELEQLLPDAFQVEYSLD